MKFSLALVYILLIIFVCYMAYYLYTSLRVPKLDTVPVTASNNKIYRIHKSPDQSTAVDLLSQVEKRLEKLINRLEQINKSGTDNGMKQYYQRLIDKKDKLELIENAPGGRDTSYTINKESIVLCMRSGKTGELHDINLIMYVAIHELAHVACPEIDHTPLYKSIFVSLLKEADRIGIYKPENYKINPVEYCGMTVREDLLS
jgi:predicted metal-dependent hydrolase